MDDVDVWTHLKKCHKKLQEIFMNDFLERYDREVSLLRHCNKGNNVISQEYLMILKKFGCKQPSFDRFGISVMENGYVEIRYGLYGDLILVPFDFAMKVLVLGGLP
jgi:hypothetical protein